MTYENLNINGLFYSIDTIKNTTEENDTIFSHINTYFKNKLRKYYNHYLKKKEKHETLKKYKVYLLQLYSLIDSQISLIDSLMNCKLEYDFEDTYHKMKSELKDLCMLQVDLDFIDVDRAIEDNEKNIYRFNYYYSTFVNHYTESELTNTPFTYQKTISDDSFRDLQTNFFFLVSLHNRKNRDSINLNNHLLHNYSLFAAQAAEENNESVNFCIDLLDSSHIPLELLQEYYVSQFKANLSRVIYLQRSKLDLTQKELADLNEIDRTMITKIERANQNTTSETAIKLLTTLGIGVTFYPLK